MRLRNHVLLVAASMMAIVIGCAPPREVGPVAPPGFEFTREPAIPAGEDAQALGEQTSAAIANNQNQKKVTPKAANSPPTPIGKPTTTASGLAYETLKEGTGAIAQSGQNVTMSYKGSLADGTVFDSSESFSTPIGIGKVIDGWDEGVPGMKVGERRKLTVPPALGYGPGGFPPKIPGNAVLIFEVELLGVK